MQAESSSSTSSQSPAADASLDEMSPAVEITAEELGVLDDPANLRSSVASGIAWNTAVSIAVQASRLISSLVLVRLLNPSDYGLAGMAMIVVSFVAAFQDVGFGAGLVQRRTITETDRSTVFWTTVALGSLFTVVMMALSGVIASFFHEPQVQNLVIVLSLTLFIGSLGMTQGSLLHRAMAYKATSIRLIIATVGACAVAIAVAAAGGGAWALIAYQLTITSLVTILLWQLAAWRPRFTYARASLKRFAGFGSNILGSRFLDFLQTNMDNILVGRYLGSASLGLYSVSYNVILIPLGRLFAPIGGTLFAAGSRMQDEPHRIASVWTRAVRGALAVILPTVLGLLVVTPEFVEVVLGAQWHAATPVIRILSLITVAYGLSILSDGVLLALDRSHIVFRLTLLNTLLAIGAFIVGLHWGVVGVAVSYTIVTIPISLTRVAIVNRVVGVSLVRFLAAISGVVQATVLMTAVCWVADEGLDKAGVSPAARLAVVVLIGVVAYTLATAWRNRVVIDDVMSLSPRLASGRVGRLLTRLVAPFQRGE